MTNSRHMLGAFLVALLSWGTTRADDEPPPEPETLSLSDAQGLAMEHHLELRSFERELRAADARVLQATAHSNPELSFELENWGGSLPGTAYSEATLELLQRIELGGKRDARAGVAEGERVVLQSDLEALRRAILTDVTHRYLAALAADDAVGLARENVETADSIAASVRRRVEAGVSPPAELTRAEIEVSRAQMESRSSEEERALSHVRLASLWGSTSPRFQRLSGTLDSPAPVPDRDALLARTGDSPEVLRWQSEVELREQSLRAEKASRVPDLHVGMGARRFAQSDDYGFLASVALPLPILNRNHQGILAAEAAQAAAQSRLEEARTRQRLDIIEVHTGLTRSHARLDVLRARVLPGAEKAFHEIEQGFRQGRFSSLDLLEARRTWTAARRDEIETILTIRQAEADLERLTGAPSPGGTTP